MSEILSRWPVVVSLPVGADDRDGDGMLTEDAVGRLFAQARTAYFDECRTVDAADVVLRATQVIPGDVAVGDAGVTVSVSIVEVFDDRFTMEARFRPANGPGIAAMARSSMSPGGEVSKAMRDEFIALAHAARHMH